MSSRSIKQVQIYHVQTKARYLTYSERNRRWWDWRHGARGHQAGRGETADYTQPHPPHTEPIAAIGQFAQRSVADAVQWAATQTSRGKHSYSGEVEATLGEL